MSQDLRDQIYYNLKQKDTDELLEIWRANNRSEWSDTAFDVIADLLVLRLVEVPPQSEPVYTPGGSGNDDDEDDDEETDERFVDEDNAPVFYSPQEVLLLGDWLRWTAIAAVVIVIITNLLSFASRYRGQLFLSSQAAQPDFIGALFSLISASFDIALAFAMFYFPLKALAQILHILMEMEFNSRSVK